MTSLNSDRSRVGRYWIYERVADVAVQPHDDIIDVFRNENGDTWPLVALYEAGVRVDHEDGRWHLIPWASVRSVWFEPAPKADSNA